MKRAYGLDVPETLSEALDPDRTALIVYNMQVGIMRQLQHAAEITAKVGEVLAAARDAGIRTYLPAAYLAAPEPDGCLPAAAGTRLAAEDLDR